MNLCRKILVLVCGALLLKGFATDPMGNLPIQPLVKPGYQPGADEEKDVRGLWMEMAEAEVELKRSPLVVQDAMINDYVKGLACEVARDYCDDLRIYVIQSPAFNASITPNGIMIVNTGLLTRMTSSDQVAAVLGHELAHYTQTHSLLRLRAAKRNALIGTLLELGGLGGLPSIFAFSAVIKFSRDQESEADILGAYFMAGAGYAPQAAADIWVFLEEEEENASVKRPKGLAFLSSHPNSDKRAKDLAAEAQNIAPNMAKKFSIEDDPLLEVLKARYEFLMDEQTQQRDDGRLLTLLQRHADMGIPLSNIEFYRGEAFRIRGGEGDDEKAVQAYERAIRGDSPLPRAFRELGYLEYKRGNRENAKEYFREFLARTPDASDRAMIEFYLGEGW